MGETKQRASDLQRRIDDLVAQVERDAAEIESLRAKGVADQIVIDELRADGELERSHIEQLGAALAISREIGAAVGIVMERHRLDSASAFAYLARLSQAENRKVKDIAADLVDTPRHADAV